MGNLPAEVRATSRCFPRAGAGRAGRTGPETEQSQCWKHPQSRERVPREMLRFLPCPNLSTSPHGPGGSSPHRRACRSLGHRVGRDQPLPCRPEQGTHLRASRKDPAHGKNRGFVTILLFPPADRFRWMRVGADGVQATAVVLHFAPSPGGKPTSQGRTEPVTVAPRPWDDSSADLIPQGRHNVSSHRATALLPF